MSVTSIEWTDVTWNPVRGCSRVSEGCRNCYAERIASRFARLGRAFDGFAYDNHIPGINGKRRGWTGRVELLPDKLDEPLRWRKPRRVFVNSMSDLFHEALPHEAIAAVFGVMAGATAHTFQILTKRPERMRRWFEWYEGSSGAGARGFAAVAEARQHGCAIGWPLVRGNELYEPAWPLPNVWLGVSVEDQATADERIPLLLQTPAAKRFVSYEPALGPVDFSRYLGERRERVGNSVLWRSRGLDWIIVGGESGPCARPFDVAWARSTVEQCKAAGVAVFVKQLGARGVDDVRGRHIVEGRWIQGKGGDPAEWPADLRVREFPA